MAPNVYPVGVVPVPAGWSICSCSWLPATQCHPVPLPSLQGNNISWQFCLCSVIAHWLYGNTLRVCFRVRSIAVSSPLEEHLDGLSVKWRGLPLASTTLLSSCRHRR